MIRSKSEGNVRGDVEPISPGNMSASPPADSDDFSSASSAVAARARPGLNQVNPKGAPRAVAYNGGPANFAQDNGVCYPCHGPRRNEVRAKGKRCNVDGCAKQARGGQGVCVGHGAKVKVKTCSVKGCNNIVIRGGVCIRHGAKVKAKRCSAEGCENYAPRGGVCIRHGAKVKTCNVEGCDNYALKGGACYRHGAKVKKKACSFEECGNQVQRGGVCIRHGAKVEVATVKRDRCSIEGCAQQAVKGGICAGHGAKLKTCRVEGCTKLARKRGARMRNKAKGDGACEGRGSGGIEGNERGKKRKKNVWRCDVCKEAWFDDYDVCVAHERACALARRPSGGVQAPIAVVEGDDGEPQRPVDALPVFWF